MLRKELKFVLATHTDGRVWTRGGASVKPGGARGAVRSRGLHNYIYI